MMWRAVSARHSFVVASKGTFYDMFFNDVDGKGNDIQRKGNRGFLYEIDDCVRSVNNSIEAGCTKPPTSQGAIQLEQRDFKMRL